MNGNSTTSSNAQAEWFGHPRGLFVLFTTEMWERFSYYGMRAILFLYMTKTLMEGGMALSEVEAGAIYALYTASVYLLSLPGGWVADNLLGQRKTIWYGGIVIMIGHIILAIPAGEVVFFLGLATVAVGTGLLKPNISAIVGELYPEGGARRDAAFSIFYMGINLGSFLGQLVVGYLGEKVDWHAGFGAAAIGMFLGLISFKYIGGKHLKDYGNAPKAATEAPDPVKARNNRLIALGMISVFVTMMAVLQVTNQVDLTTAKGIADAMKYIISAVAIFFFAYVLLDKQLTGKERKRVLVMIVFFIAAALFWSGFEQAGSSLTIFADRHTDRMILGWEMPASWFQSYNPLFIFLFAPVFASMWINLGARNLNPSAPVKFALGVIFMGLGFLVMVFGAKVAVEGQLVSSMWLVMTYFLHTVGELCLSPVGLSFYTKLSPKRYVSQMMGVWFVATSLGNLLAGLFAGNFDEGNVAAMPNLFGSIVYFSAAVGGIMLVFSGTLKRWMGDVE